MRAACITVPSRLGMLTKTLMTFGLARFSIVEMDVYVDEQMHGEYWNARRALEGLYRSGESYVMFLEDDCEFIPTAGALLADFQRQYRVECISLATTQRDSAIMDDKSVNWYEHWTYVNWAPWGTQCVVLSRDMLGIILKEPFWNEPDETLDIHLFSTVLKYTGQIWMRRPGLVHHAGWNSTTLKGKAELTPELCEERKTC